MEAKEDTNMENKHHHRNFQYSVVFVTTFLTFSVFLSYNLYISSLESSNFEEKWLKRRSNGRVKRHWEGDQGYEYDEYDDYDELFDKMSETPSYASTTKPSATSTSTTTTTTTTTSASTFSSDSSIPSTSFSESSPTYSKSSPSTSMFPSIASNSSSQYTSEDNFNGSSSESSLPSSPPELSSNSSGLYSSSNETSSSYDNESSSNYTSSNYTSLNQSSPQVPSLYPSSSPSSQSQSRKTTSTSVPSITSDESKLNPTTGYFFRNVSSAEQNSTASSANVSESNKVTGSESMLSKISSMFATGGTPTTSPPSKLSTRSSSPTTPSLTSSELAKTAVENYFNSVTMMTTSKPGENGKDSTEPPPDSSGPQDENNDTVSGERDESALPTTPQTAFVTSPAGPCFQQPYALTNVCSKMILKLAGVSNYKTVSLEDVASMLFSETVLDNLQQQCAPSVWCLAHQPELVYDPKEYLDFCDLDCMLDMPDDCLNGERRLVLATLGLMCEGEERNVTDSCHQAMRKNTHVAMTDLYRTRFQKGKEVCQGESQKTCNGSCQQMGSNLHCMCASCNHEHMDMFEQYEHWGWFFQNESADMMKTCNINETTVDCRLFNPEYTEGWWDSLMKENTFLEAVQEMDAAIISGLITSFVITTLGVAGVVWICVKKTTGWKNPCAAFYKRDAVEYSEIKNGDIDLFDDDLDA